MRTLVGRTLPILAATLAFAFSLDTSAAAGQKSQAEKGGAPASIRGSALSKDWASLIRVCREESRDLHKAVEALKARQDPRAPKSHIQALSDLARQWSQHADALERLGRGKEEGVRSREAKRITKGIEGLARKTSDELSARDKMGNFDVQELMSRATQARNLAAAMQKDADKSEESIVDKVG